MADPIVLKGGIMGPPMYVRYQLVVYLISTVEMGVFLVWRTLRKRPNGLAPVFAGALLAAGGFSGVIGLAILPLTIFGLIFLVGIFGFIPFFTAFVYLRSGVRALRVPLKDWRLSARLAGVVLGAALAIGLPNLVATEWERDVSNTVNTLISGSATDAEAAAHHLKDIRVVPLSHRFEIEDAYRRESDPVKKELLRRTYADITGENPPAWPLWD